MQEGTPFSRLTGLILIPVILLAGIAALGLFEYRHAITADARDVAQSWTKKSATFYDRIISATETLPTVKLYPEIPADSARESPDAAKLDSKDVNILRSLLGSTGKTASGLPVRLLAAWRIFDLTPDKSDATVLAQLAIHDEPSSISAPILQSLIEKFPDNSAWGKEWRVSEERRAVLTRHSTSSGFVETDEGPAFVWKGKVLTPAELKKQAQEIHAEIKIDFASWMTLDFVALDNSLLAPVPNPLSSSDSPLKIIVGIDNPKALYARYWNIVWWTAALIICALATAITGIILVNRTVERERRLGELKSQFVASVSHELRAPVASMRLMADALEAGKVTGEKAHAFHQLMSQEGARLSSLIENVLDFARIEEDRKDYHFVDADLSALVAHTLELMKPVATERGIQINAELGQEVFAKIDPTAIEQALVNLLDNAIKFSPKSGRVRVILRPGWELAISDDGPGIPKKDHNRIFERFTRLENELRRETKGTGIGLSIVKHIVEAHGGTITVDGSTFTIKSNISVPVMIHPKREVPNQSAQPA